MGLRGGLLFLVRHLVSGGREPYTLAFKSLTMNGGKEVEVEKEEKTGGAYCIVLAYS